MGGSILVVDDDEVLGRVLSRVLKNFGYRVLHAAAPEQAVRLARQEPPALALVDLCMPGLSGVELALQLRAELPELALVLMTAYPLRLADQPELARHFARVLIKPLDLAQLRETVEAVLPRTAGAGLVKLS